MALSFSNKVIYTRSSPLGGVKLVKNTITFDGSYAANGYAVTPAQLGFPNGILDGPSGGTVGGYQVSWVDSTGKLKVFRQNGSTGALAEAATNEAGLNGDVLTCVSWGY